MKWILLFFLLIIIQGSSAPKIIKNEDVIISGPMASGTTDSSTIIFIQTKIKYDFKLYYKEKYGNNWNLANNIKINNDYIYNIYLNKLKSNTVYELRLLVDNYVLNFGYPLNFKTAPISYIKSKKCENIKFAFGSCSGIKGNKFKNVKEFYKPPKINNNIYDNIAKHPIDFMLLTGDNIYLEDGDYDDSKAIYYRYKYCRSLPNLQKLMRTTTHYATIDDHDYSYDNGDYSYPLKDTSEKVFKLFFPYEKNKDINFEGVTHKIEYGDIDFFLLDDRYYRNEKEKTLLGKEQLQWLKNNLKTSKNNFKCVVIGTQILNETLAGESMINDFKEETMDIFNWIKDNKIEGVFFITGDRHYTEICKYNMKNSYPFYEFSISSLTSTSGSLLTLLPNRYRLNGLVYGKNNYGLIKLFGNEKDRKLFLSIYNKDNKLIFTFQLKLSDLKFKTTTY